MCLNCAGQMCAPQDIKDNSCAGHAYVHYKTPRSDLHCAYVNLENWGLFCYLCNENLYIDSYKKLREAAELVKKINEAKGISTQSGGNQTAKKVVKNAMTNSGSTVQRARGLTNLGNTCFFNAVMQCLSQSHPLTHVLDQHCQKGASFATPAIKLPQISKISSGDAVTNSTENRYRDDMFKHV